MGGWGCKTTRPAQDSELQYILICLFLVLHTFGEKAATILPCFIVCNVLDFSVYLCLFALTFNNLIRMWFVHPLFLQNIPTLHIFYRHNCTLIGNVLWDTEVLLSFFFGLLVVFVPGFFVCLPFSSQSSCLNSFLLTIRIASVL